MSVFDEDKYPDKNAASDSWKQFGDGIGKLQQESEQDLVNWRTKVWPRAYKYYECKHDRSMFQGQDTIYAAGRDYPVDKAIFRPIVPTQVEAATARLGDAIGGDNRFSFKPYVEDLETGAKKDELWGYANAVQHLVNTQLAYDVLWPHIAKLVCREAQKYGTAVMRYEWLKMTRPGYAWNQQQQSGEWLESKTGKDEVLVDGLAAYIVPIGDFFPDPAGRSINREDGSTPCGHTIERRWYRTDELASRIMAAEARNWTPEFKSGGKLDREKIVKFLKAHESEPDNSEDWLRAQQEAVGKYAGRSTQTSESRRKIRALVYCEGLPDPCYALAIGKKGGEVAILVDRDPHPNRFAPIPYALFKSIPQANELFGQAKIQWLAQIVHEINALANIRMSGVVRSVNGVWLCNNYMQIFAANLLSMPGGAIDVQNAMSLDNALKHIPVQDNAAGLHREIDELQMYFNLAWGSTDPMMGNPTASAMDATARGVLSAIEQGGVKLNSEASSLVATGMIQMARVMVGLDRQYVSRTRYVEIAGKEGADAWSLQVSPAMLQRRYRIFFSPSPIVTSPSAQAQKYINFGNLCAKAPGFPWQKFMPAAARALEIDDPDAYGGSGEHQTPQWHENAIWMATGEMPDARQTDPHAEHLDQLLTPENLAHAEQTGTQAGMRRHQLQHQNFIAQAQAAASGVPSTPGATPEPPTGAPELPPPPPPEGGPAQVPEGPPPAPGEVPIPNPSEMTGPQGMPEMGELPEE